MRGDRGGPHNQGVLNLVDNDEQDGGTAVVPGFHHCYSQWSKALGPWEKCRVGQRRRGNAFVFGNPFDPIHKLMRRVTMRAGSLVLWNQCLVHGAVPNASKNCRVAQFVRGFRAGEMSISRNERRQRAIIRELKLAGSLGELGGLAPHVFGVKFPAEVDMAACAEVDSDLLTQRSSTDCSGADGPSPCEGAVWTGTWPRQLSSAEASQFAFNSLLDLMPTDSRPFIVPVHPDVDTRVAMSFRKLHEMAATLAKDPALARFHGHRIAVVLPNGPELAACFLALSLTVQVAPLNPELSADELDFALQDLPAVAVVVRKGMQALLPTLNVPIIELIPDPITCGCFSLNMGHIKPEPELPPSRAEDRTRGRVALVMHTSGTTRRPKLVPLTHSQLGMGGICVASTLRLKRSSLAINVMPLFHLHGLMVNVLTSAIAGASVLCAPRFDPALFFRWLLPVSSDDEKQSRAAPDWYSAVPTIHQEVLRYAEILRDRDGSCPAHSLRLIRNCSAALAPSIGARLEAALPGAVVVTSYAMTEALPICSNEVGALRDLNSVGPAAGPDVRVVDEHNVPVPEGEEGEVVVRGHCVFAGYETRDHLGFDPNELAFHPGGWFRSGDKGRLDKNGHLHLTGRFKELINRAGEKISPVAVEHALLELAPELLPGLHSLMAFAAPHEELGEAVGVAVVCDKGVTVSLVEVRRCGTQSGLLGKRWLPQMLVHLSDLPKGPTGKPDRIGLAEKLRLPVLSFKKSMSTVDLRGGQSLDYESGRRAEARKAAAKRSAARRGQQNQPSSFQTVVAVQAPVGSVETMTDCMQLVKWAMAEATGEIVEETDDLFDAGLSSISVTRLRDEIETKVGLTLPPNLVYDHATVRSLAAAIYCVKRSATNGSDTAMTDNESVPLISLQAMKCFREGDLANAEALCIRAFKSIGLPNEWSSSSTAEPPMLDESAAGELVPHLSLMVSVWIRAKRPQEAHAACKLLVAARSQSANKTGSIDSALVWAQLARLDLQLGDHQAAAKAAAIAAVDGDLLARPRVSSANHGDSTSSAVKCDANCVELLVLGRTQVQGSWCFQCLALETLVLRQQGLECFPSCIAGLVNLRILDASDNAIAILPESMSALVQLRELILNCNALSSLPECLAKLPELHTVSVQSNHFKQLPSVVLRCVQLKTFRWGGQTVLPDQGRPQVGSSMTTEDFEAKLEAICLAVSMIEDQIELDPDNMQLLNDLQHLHRQYSEAVWLSKGMPAVDELSISAQEAPTKESLEVPSSVLKNPGFASPVLRVLEMEGNHETALAVFHPESVALTAVLASFNRLERLPAQLTSVGQSLKRLQLGSNNIDTIDEQILGALVGLTCLMLEANRLRELPSSIGELRQLRELALYGNRLHEFPSELGQCASLTKLDAHHNCLETLPAGMATLSQLSSLYLQNNRLRGLATLRGQVLSHLPLHNLGLGSNCFDLSEAFEQPGTRVGLAWNHGAPPASSGLRGVLTDRFATTDHLYDPASKTARGELLLVAFAAQGPGMQQWASPTAAIRSAGLSIDTLYLADPSNSYYMCGPASADDFNDDDGASTKDDAALKEQCPHARSVQFTGRATSGLSYFAELIARHAQHYDKVMIVGSSMGATAALMHADLAHRVLAFGPRIDLERTHGSFLEPPLRAACTQQVMRALQKMGEGESRVQPVVSVHVGAGNLEDVLQARLIERLSAVRVVQHDTFQHNVPMHLEREGLLVPLLKRELLALMLDTSGLAAT